ncbi:MAG TPA: hypothetical protein VFS38_05170 [Actinomycetota bacterium]|jgi:hypothetical protein|nr:hypothetical protein [Actinomycetota bacterium]
MDFLQAEDKRTMIGIVVLLVTLWAGAAVALVGYASSLSRRSSQEAQSEGSIEQEVIR